jgi:hypothetical protein
VFSRFFFRLEGKRPIIKDFHAEWIRSVIVAYAVGGKQLILSPPRHGKSEMLVRFVIWFIAMDPNIRIMWVAASKDVAEIMIGAIKDHLENNEELVAAVLPPGDTFRPDRSSGRKWTGKEIKVRQCTHVGQKSSTVIALGRTSKILSRDVDILITDDIEDFDTTRELSQRIYSRNKMAEIGTRKEEHTAWLYISSRQHPDDIPQHLQGMEDTDQAWRVIVDTAHAEDCAEDPEIYENHTACMLFPEVRSYRWLMEKKVEMEHLGIAGAYEMRYLNRPIPDSGIVFDVPLIREVALIRERGIGLGSPEEGWQVPLGHLVGGLDPSARGIQASFLWNYRKDVDAPSGIKMSMIDLDAKQSGGVQGAIDTIMDWYARYQLVLWYYETNAQQAEFYKLVKEGVAKAMMAEYGHNPISIKEHSTGKNKQDAELGISAMAPLYHNSTVELPYGTGEARQKVNMLLRQLELWTTDGVVSNRKKTDIKLAQWFPFVGKIQSFLKTNRKVRVQEAPESSYPETGFTESPWATSYPGGF